ncbi:hypothetical protein MA16_Dca002243 [Dendrobium catenatum]|uniref:Uncharacterized protein n=1 Tax=Dendrobium catenatum TaxID=906689 RepID=A0A2I0VZY5_9ASPA|nr:hypothetical protein MA16_Dca002243 [Dendrobium catenatum]
MSDKPSDENKHKVSILDHSEDSKAVFEESKITSTADETPQRKLFIETEASWIRAQGKKGGMIVIDQPVAYLIYSK